MGNMISIGQGAGIAAALSARADVRPRDLDVKLIQDQLSALGASL
jgi:hypothetical protein